LITHHGKTPYLLSLPCLYIKLKTLARIIWATAREDVTPLTPLIPDLCDSSTKVGPKLKEFNDLPSDDTG
jgi:hypothetical protein